MPDTFVCFICTIKEAGKEQGQKTELEDGTVKVLRTMDPKENISVKETLVLDNGDTVLYLYAKPKRPKHLSKEEVRRRATEK